MIPGSCPVVFADQTLHLLPDRAVWWPDRAAVVIADPHLGKAASFRKTGVPVPRGTTGKDLDRITSLLQQTQARRLIVLGDFLHSRAGRQAEVLDAIATWRAAHAAIAITLIRGNHDHSAGKVPPEWNIDEAEEPMVESGVALVHDPACPADVPTLAGHLHPVIPLEDFDRSRVSAPCFVFDPRCAILPAFGSFTGGWRMGPAPGRRVFLATTQRVVEVPGMQL